MDNKKTIDQYIAVEMTDKINKKANSPLLGIVLFVVGVLLLIFMNRLHASDSVQSLMLTVGLVALAVGLVLTAMTLSRALWHYRYLPTGSNMRFRMVYFSMADYATAVEAIGSGKMDTVGKLSHVVSSNYALRMLISADNACLLLQAGRLDTGHFEPETDVTVLVGTEIAAIEMLCK